ncbi:MAG: hypothetical protein ACW98Y_11025 [Candidatus Thorarchaeota archaeon]
MFTYEEQRTFTINLAKRFDGVRTILDSHSQVPVAGWHHFDVTRDTTGLLSVDLNGSRIMQAEDTDIDTSEMFWLWFSNGGMIDNIEVVTTTPDGQGNMTTLLIIAGSGIAVVVIVLVVWKTRMERK